MFYKKKILITGGTGSFGKAFVKHLLSNYKVSRLVVFSRDELKQHDMKLKFPPEKFKQLRFFLGDVRDLNRLKRALENIDIIIHAAALKQVPTAEYDPFEYVNTNIIGAQNIIEASLENKKIEKVIALSTDKACSPINLYGATKLCSDKLFIAANNLVGNKKIKFSVVRYGNVFGSRGSVATVFKKNALQNKKLLITDKRMTRFSTTLIDGIKMVEDALKFMEGGEIFVQKNLSYRITDLATTFSNKISFTKIRPGEKLHEEMISASDSYDTYDLGKYYVICSPTLTNLRKKYKKFKKFKEGNSYNSLNNKFLNKIQLRNLIKTLT